MRRALTIYEKMQIVNYAQELEDKAGGTRQPHPKTRLRSKSDSSTVTWKKKGSRKGLNLQHLCKTKFGDQMGAIKICVLRKRAREQKWAELTESQQRSMYSLTDEMKKHLQLHGTMKGWRSLGEEDVSALVQNKGKLQRWKIPVEVLKDKRDMGTEHMT